MLAIAGFLTIFIILFLIIKKYSSPLVALSLVPCIACIVVGQGDKLPAFATSGVTKIATTGVMFIFSVTFFGIMSDAGAFDVFINKAIKFSKGDPVKVLIATWIFTMIGHLDGSGISTVLLVIPPMLPIVERLNMTKLYFCAIFGMTAGVMNIVPWGGPTLRAATALNMNVMDLWIPFIPTQLLALLLVVPAYAIYWGRKDKARLLKDGLLHDSSSFNADDYMMKLTPEQEKLRRPKLVVINWILIIAVLGGMCTNIVSPLIAFMFGVVLALIINYRDAAVQREMVDEKGKDALLLSSVIFAAGIMMGVLGETGMSKAMTQSLVNVIPVSLSPFIAPIIGFFSIPLHLLFDADSYYFGVMPIIAEAAASFGVPAVDVARASIIGQTTVGWPVSPMVGTFFLFVGMCKLDIGEWQKWAIKYFMSITTIMTLFAMLTGLFTL